MAFSFLKFVQLSRLLPWIASRHASLAMTIFSQFLTLIISNSHLIQTETLLDR